MAVDNEYILGYEDLFPFPVMWEDSFVVYKFNQNLKCKNNTNPFNDKTNNCILYRFKCVGLFIGGFSVIIDNKQPPPLNLYKIQLFVYH